MNSATIVGLLGAEGGGQLIVDLLRRPLVLAAVTARERALHLAEDRAGHERNAVGPVAELTHHVLVVGNDLPVERGAPDFLRRGSQRGHAGGNERRVRHRLQLVDLVAAEIQVLERVRRDRLLRLDARGDVGRAIGVVAAALRRDLVEQPLGGRHVHHADDFAAATGLAEDHHVRGIAAEGFDVLLHPLQRRHQIGRARVAGVRILRTVGGEIQRAEDVQPVIHADHDDVAELAERAPVVRVRLHRRAVGEAAAVHPHHDRLLRRRS